MTEFFEHLIDATMTVTIACFFYLVLKGYYRE